MKYKYHPDEYPKRREEQRQVVKRRLATFMDLYQKGYLNDVVVDSENQRGLTRFLDAGRMKSNRRVFIGQLKYLVVIKLEGGTDQDLRVLDIVTSSSNTTNENDDGENEGLKQTSTEKSESSTSLTATTSKKSSEEKVSELIEG